MAATDTPRKYSVGGTPIESFTTGVPVINTDHEAIHLGFGYSASVYAEAIADDGLRLLELVTPAASSGYVHLKAYKPWSEGGVAKFEIVEAPTLTTGSTALVPLNRKRTGTPGTSAVVLKTDPTSISAGTVIEGPTAFGGGGAGAGVGGNFSNDQEIVLKPSTTYLFRLTNLAGAAKAMGLWIFWYEEPLGA